MSSFQNESKVSAELTKVFITMNSIDRTRHQKSIYVSPSSKSSMYQFFSSVMCYWCTKEFDIIVVGTKWPDKILI